MNLMKIDSETAQGKNIIEIFLKYIGLYSAINTNPFQWANSTARTTSLTRHIWPLDFRHCWSNCKKQHTRPTP